MEITLKTNNESSLAKIIALAKKLNVTIEQTIPKVEDKGEREALKNWILNFKAIAPSSFGDALEWQLKEREDRELPFSE